MRLCSRHTKSTMYLPVGNCLRNLQFIIRRSRSFDQSSRSASVDCLLICLALDICGITLTAGHTCLAARFSLPPVSPRGGVTLTPCIKYGAGSRSSPDEEGESPSPSTLSLRERGLSTGEGEGAGESPSPRIKYGAGSRSSPGEEGGVTLSPAQPSPLGRGGRTMGHSCLAARFAYLMSAREGESPSLPVSSTGQAPGDGSHPHLNPLPEGEGVGTARERGPGSHPHPNPLPEGEGVGAEGETG